jgi:hypothetical protein
VVGLEEMVAPNASQVAAISRLFSSAVFREFARNGRSSLFARLFLQTGVAQACQQEATVADGFEAAYCVLKAEGMRNEYIYRTALTKKILLGRHSLNTACMLPEFRAGSCKADLVILNGTATAYEIKSERDSLSRVLNQVSNYKKVFAKVNVIASESHLDSILASTPSDVGVLCLSRRYQISTVREAEECPDRICPVTVLESLRSIEASSILKLLDVAVPDVPNTRRHLVMRKAFENLDPASLHFAMVEVLKRTRDLAPLGQMIRQLPPSLHASALSIRVTQQERDRLVHAVSMPLDEQLAWG